MSDPRQVSVVGGGRDGAVRCAFVGDEPLTAQCIDIARAAGLEIALVATANDIVRAAATEQEITVVEPGGALLAGLDLHPADVLLSVANLRLVSDAVLERVQLAINYHDGPLPGYAGLNVTSWALLAGEQEHTITWHLMTAAVDGGDIVAVEPFPIAPDETGFSLNARCYEAALATFPAIAAMLAAGVIEVSTQPSTEARMFMRHDRPARLVDPTVPAAETARDVRALDLGHRLRNGLGVVRWLIEDDLYVVDAARAERALQDSEPGTILAADAAEVRMSTVDGDLIISAVSTPEGRPVDLGDLTTRHRLTPGAVITAPDGELNAALLELEPLMSRDELFWLNRRHASEAIDLPVVSSAATRSRCSLDRPPGVDDATVVAAIAAWIARLSGAAAVSFDLSDEHTRHDLRRTGPLARPGTATFDVAPDVEFATLATRAAAELDRVARRRPLLRDAVGRDPRTRGGEGSTSVSVDVGPGAGEATADDAAVRVAVLDATITIDAGADGGAAAVDRLAEQLRTLLAAAVDDPSAQLGDLPVLGAADHAVLDELNDTDVEHDRLATIDSLFDAQARRTPQSPAVSYGPTTLTYGELQLLVRGLAARLTVAGVKRGDRVGIAVPRGISMIVGVLATLDVGAAYLPLDPTYPVERLRFMVEDSGITVLLAAGTTASELGRGGITVIDPSAAADATSERTTDSHAATDLAYVIYTSGSTGAPKGVMLEHRQVVNFFAAMDLVVGADEAGTWLAVTSLSFDISVLELLWTLTRGFHVVIKPDRVLTSAGGAAPAPAARPVTFSLFYFAAGEETAADGYRLLLESARFADRHGFEAVWTPERHFHAFGGAYPNPSVIGAALAAITSNVGIRAGSVVLPLHSPIRVAEEWAVVDNLSRGRVAISFAAGWQPNDFVLNPAAYATAKQDLASNIDIVQRLWRGDTVPAPGHDGAPVNVRTLPRPVQAELPIWLTSAGTPATFERAGTLGVNVLTHLLGQSVEQLTQNIATYRAAWSAAGHAGVGRVTLMMHTYLDRDAQLAREVAREPMKQYLGTAVGLLRDVASAFPTFANRGKDTDDLFKSLSADELDQLLEVAAHRYLDTSGLFGTAEEAAAVVEVVSAAGVDEVACLIDFGVDTDSVLDSLDRLLDAKSMVDANRTEELPHTAQIDVEPEVAESVAELVDRHRVTHLQCTPSLAAMLLADPEDRRALGDVRHLMLGGEALPTELAAELRAILPGRFTNMYGPTETTIWSLTHEVAEIPVGAVPIGRPIANTTVFVLDDQGRQTPVGCFGELHIGGEGLARGYHDRPELTSERFVERPGLGRTYATGDVARVRPDGLVEFAGRADNQVKIRGHRIELGEIEAALDRHPDVVQAVVVARPDQGTPRLIAYVVLRPGADVTGDALRGHVADALPEAMVPSAIVRLDALPLTPNGKIDRKRLPEDAVTMGADARSSTAPPADDTEQLVADIWASELERAVGRDDNFFDIGGHSLLAVKVFRRLTDTTGLALALTDVFRFPTVRTFAAHVARLRDGSGTDGPSGDASSISGTDRGERRRRALSRRGAASPGT